MSNADEEHDLAVRMMQEMQAKLADNRDRPHWRKADANFLLGRLLEEVAELSRAERSGNETATWAEAADVANLAAMLADNVGRAPA